MSVSKYNQNIGLEVDKLRWHNELVETGFLAAYLSILVLTLALSAALYPQVGLWALPPVGAGIASVFTLKILSMLREKGYSPEARGLIFENFREGVKKAKKVQAFAEAAERTLGSEKAEPVSLLIEFLKDPACGQAAAAIIAGDAEGLGEAKIDWAKSIEGYSLLDLSALMVNETKGDAAQKEILVSLHQRHAAALKGCKNKASLQAKALFRSAELVLRNGFSDSTIQAAFAKITQAYAPDCPHTSYVTASSLEKVDYRYNANQKFYAEWCHITALAFASLNADDFDQHVALGSRSRSLLAQICCSCRADQFGCLRIRSRLFFDVVENMGTPLSANYLPWKPLLETRYANGNGEYQVMAVDVDGNKYPGTIIGPDKFINARKEVFCWQHGEDQVTLHEISHNWLQKLEATDYSDDDAFYHDLGMYYHALTQYTPFHRGSATFSYQELASQFLKRGLPLPKAVTLLDCYALSLQAEEFVQEFFIPWCKGEAGEAELQERLNAKSQAS